MTDEGMRAWLLGAMSYSAVVVMMETLERTNPDFADIKQQAFKRFQASVGKTVEKTRFEQDFSGAEHVQQAHDDFPGLIEAQRSHQDGLILEMIEVFRKGLLGEKEGS